MEQLLPEVSKYTFEKVTFESSRYGGEIICIDRETGTSVERWAGPLIPGSQGMLAAVALPTTGYAVGNANPAKTQQWHEMGFGNNAVLDVLSTGVDPAAALGMAAMEGFYTANREAPMPQVLYVVSSYPTTALYTLLRADSRFVNTEIVFVRAACSGFAHSLSLAHKRQQAAQEPLSVGILTSEVMSEMARGDDTVNFIMGDAATFVLMPSLGEKAIIRGSASHYQADTTDLLMPDYSADVDVVAPAQYVSIKSPLNYANPKGLSMPGGGTIYKLVGKVVPEVFAQAIKDAGGNIPDIITFHNANLRMPPMILKNIADSGIFPSVDKQGMLDHLTARTIVDMASVGNTSASSIPLSLMLAQHNEKYTAHLQFVNSHLSQGNAIRIIFTGFGGGFYAESVVMDIQ